jgi:hemerythrin
MGVPHMPVAEVLERIDSEHQQLKQLLGAVAGICPEVHGSADCQACGDAVVLQCECLLHEHLGEMLALMAGHFRYKDGVMRAWRLLPSAPEACDRHQRDHSRISAQASRMVADLEQGYPLKGIRDMHGLLDHWIECHIEEHDQEMIRLLHGAAKA